MFQDVEGLFPCGSTRQTIALASQLENSATLRAQLRRLLDEMDRPIRYSNEDFDRRQHLAGWLADVVRAWAARKSAATLPMTPAGSGHG